MVFTISILYSQIYSHAPEWSMIPWKVHKNQQEKLSCMAVQETAKDTITELTQIPRKNVSKN